MGYKGMSFFFAVQIFFQKKNLTATILLFQPLIGEISVSFIAVAKVDTFSYYPNNFCKYL